MDRRNIRRSGLHLFKKPVSSEKVSNDSDDEGDMFVKGSQTSSTKTSGAQRLRLIASQKSSKKNKEKLSSDNEKSPEKTRRTQQRPPSISPPSIPKVSSAPSKESASSSKQKTSKNNQDHEEEEEDDEVASSSEVEMSPQLVRKSQQERSRLARTKKRTKSPEVSTSNIKRPRNILHQVTNNNKEDGYDDLEAFFQKCGITTTELNDQQVYSIENDSLTTVKKIQKVLCSGTCPKDQVIKDWKKFIENVKNLKKAMEPTVINGDQRLVSSSGSSLVRILLQVPVLQTEVLNSLLKKLTDAVLIADSRDDVPWAGFLLQQFRFLEKIVDPEGLKEKLEAILESSPIWFQLELISILPDIVTDPYHQSITEMLCQLMEQCGELTNGIIDCIGNLSLGTEYQEELRQKILKILGGNNCEISNITELVKFCLADCPNTETCQKVLQVIRGLDLKPLEGENFEEYYTSQMLIVQELKINIRSSKKVSNAVAAVTFETTETGPTPMDFILVLLLCGGPTVLKKKGENILKKQIKCGYYRSSLLIEFYEGFKEVARDLQTTALNEASTLLKSGDQTLVKFAIDWIRQQFKVHSRTLHKQQEIIRRIILLMGNDDQTAKHALSVFQKMTESNEEKYYLQNHCNHLKILIDSIEQFDLDEVATLNDILYALCNDSTSTSNALQDDLIILLKKQLTTADSVIRCKGVTAAVMAIKHSAQNKDSLSTAKTILKQVEASVKDCPRAQALFYDNIGQIISNENTQIDHAFLRKMMKTFEQIFLDKYLNDNDNYRGDLIGQFELNKPDDPGYNHFVFFGDTKYGAIVSVLFRLMKICSNKLSDHNIDEFLSCGIFMPRDLEDPDPRTLDMIFYCINWYRELINAYVTRDDSATKRKIIHRLDNLMKLQGDLFTTLSLADVRYQPPPCYFQKIPPPQFNRIEKKTGKKSKKAADKNGSTSKDATKDKTNIGGDNSSSGWECWKMGSLLGIKNPMYFRRLDASVAHLLETDIDNGLKTSHVCFLVTELLSMLADETMANKYFVTDLVNLLPKICSQLNYLIEEIRSDPTDKDDYKATVKLLLELLEKILAWKGFEAPANRDILNLALQTLAKQTDESNGDLPSRREMVAAAYSYFEAMADIATQISFAYALVSMCKQLMKYSKVFAEQNRERQSNMAYGFLCLEWQDDQHVGAAYITAVTGLLKNWMDHEQDRLYRITVVLEGLPAEVDDMGKPRDNLTSLRAINRTNFHHFYRTLFDGTISGTRLALSNANSDGQKVRVWHRVGDNLKILIEISHKIPTKSTLRVFLRFMPLMLKQFINYGIPVLEKLLRHQPDEVTKVLKLMQAGTKYVNVICCHGTEKKDVALTNLVPAAKLVVEQLVYRVKAMLAANNSSTAFWMGNLVNKNLDGREILSQSSTVSDDQSIPEVPADVDDDSDNDDDLASEHSEEDGSLPLDFEDGDQNDAANDDEQESSD